MPIVGILLAAGRGVRYDAAGVQDKLMQVLPGGERVASASARHLLAVLPEVLAVVRPGADALSEALRTAGCELEVCNQADQGMGASLVCALSRVQQADGWIIALADMPYIRGSTLIAIHEALKNGADIVQPAFQGTPGNPVGFSRRHLPQLLELGGDQGARALLKAHAVNCVEVDDPGILQDIDTPADLAASK